MRHLAEERGIRQFLDIGTGLPSADNTHEVAQRVAPDTRVVSHLVLSHTVTHPDMPDVDEAVAFWNENGTPKLTQRTPAAVARYFDGLELLEPGVVSCSAWRPEKPAPDVAMYAGVDRK
ncbi:hypothetical protein GCM10010298_74000 [Streptomyces microflavus]|uniref:S-adenosyl methyltransferase n=1 Tax=Streptomyces microflavus TaxID=1919 RepID=A0A7J0CJ33_STRMI|nr:hypothetical protein Smic_10490 [Streptomyces microflavus]GGX97881.1 hypothetical protein GCM10010298_74000 [Streptomyces microflavus]